MSQDAWHVCSLVVQYAKKQAEDVKTNIISIPEAQVISTNEEECKYVVLMESEDTDLLYQKIESIHDMAGVLAVSLVYHQQDEQTEDLT